MSSDLHTHKIRGGREIVSASEIVAKYTSLEYHPWNIPADFNGLPASFYSNLPGAVAIGECGLDRVRSSAPIQVQMCAFEQICAVAEKEHKFLIIHSVRCDSEIFSVLKNFKVSVLFHGFNHAPRRLEMLLEKGAFVSLAPLAWRRSALGEYLKKCDFSKIGFESDTSESDIKDLISDATETLQRDDIGRCNDAIFDLIVGNGTQKR